MPEKKTYEGQCHCGAVRFECAADLTAITSKCNCSVCMKNRFWKAIVRPDAFRLLQGEDALAHYQFGRNVIHHMFCRTCGVKPFGQGSIEGFGSFYAINLACLDDASDAELAAAPVKFEDGRNNDWEHPPTETRYL